jgi:acyl-coenzyme A thioesterase PaaI-like protein
MQGESFQTAWFRRGMNVFPAFFGTGGRVIFLRADWQEAQIELKLKLLTRNYVGTIFGGSQFAALDPFHTVLLIKCLGPQYIVWDKAGSIRFRRPGKGRLRARVVYTNEDLAAVRAAVAENGRYDFTKEVEWLDENDEVISTLSKTVYVASKEHYKSRRR